MLDLDSGDGCGDRKCHCARYQLLEGGVYSLRVSYDFLKTGNCFRKLVCVCEPGGVIKSRRSRCYCSCFSFGNIEERGIYWLGSSYAFDEFLQSGLDMRNFFITNVTLELVDSTGKALGFCWKGKENHSLKNEERKKRERKKKIIIVCGIIGLWFCVFFLSIKGMTVLPICQGNNLVGSRIDDLLNVGIALS